MSFVTPAGGRYGGFGSESVGSGGGGGGSASASYRGGGGYDSSGDGKSTCDTWSDLQTTDVEIPHKPLPSLTSMKEQTISPIPVGPVLPLVNVLPDLSRLQRRHLDRLNLSRSQKRSICLTLEMMSLRP